MPRPPSRSFWGKGHTFSHSGLSDPAAVAAIFSVLGGSPFSPVEPAAEPRSGGGALTSASLPGTADGAVLGASVWPAPPRTVVRDRPDGPVLGVILRGARRGEDGALYLHALRSPYEITALLREGIIG